MSMGDNTFVNSEFTKPLKLHNTMLSLVPCFRNNQIDVNQSQFDNEKIKIFNVWYILHFKFIYDLEKLQLW